MACKISYSSDSMFYVGRSMRKGERIGEVKMSIRHPIYGVLSVVEEYSVYRKTSSYHIVWREDGRKGFAHPVMFADEMDPCNFDCRPHEYDWDEAYYKNLDTAKAAIHAFKFLLIPAMIYQNRKIDSKKTIAYNFEDLSCTNAGADPYFHSRTHYTREQLSAELAGMMQKYAPAFRVPHLRVRNLGKTNSGIYQFGTITLNSHPRSGGSSRGTLTHEMAHAIVDQVSSKYPYQHPNRLVASHGPEFIGVLIDLYVVLHGQDRTTLENGARAMKLDFNYNFLPTVEVNVESKDFALENKPVNVFYI